MQVLRFLAVHWHLAPAAVVVEALALPEAWRVKLWQPAHARGLARPWDLNIVTGMQGLGPEVEESGFRV